MDTGQGGSREVVRVAQLQRGVEKLLLQEERHLLYQVARRVPERHRPRSREKDRRQQQEPQHPKDRKLSAGTLFPLSIEKTQTQNQHPLKCENLRGVHLV